MMTWDLAAIMTLVVSRSWRMKMADRKSNAMRTGGAPAALPTLAAAFFVLSLGWGGGAHAQASGAAAAQSASGQGISSAQRKPPKRTAAEKAKKTQPHARTQPKGFVETIMQGPRLTTTPPEAADWVRASRPDPNAAREAARAPGPGRPVLTDEQIRAREAQLDQARARHDRIAGRKPPTGKFGSAAGKPETAGAEAYKPGCVMTCSTPISVPRTQRR